jgi:hypothetical protein
MMIHENMSKLKDEHFALLERIYDMKKDALLALPEDERADLFFPEGDSPLWDAMQDFDDKNEPTDDCLLAEQICDVLRPPSIYRDNEDDDDE